MIGISFQKKQRDYFLFVCNKTKKGVKPTYTVCKRIYVVAANVSMSYVLNLKIDWQSLNLQSFF